MTKHPNGDTAGTTPVPGERFYGNGWSVARFGAEVVTAVDGEGDDTELLPNEREARDEFVLRVAVLADEGGLEYTAGATRLYLAVTQSGVMGCWTSEGDAHAFAKQVKGFVAAVRVVADHRRADR